MVTDRQFRRQTEKRVVRVSEVNTVENAIYAQDQYGGEIQVSVHFDGTIVSVPQVGEIWTVARDGNDWFLDKQAGTSIGNLEDLEPGDRVISGARVVIQTDEMHLGGTKIVTGTGSPQGVVTAPIGSLYLRKDGGAGTTLYIKESGTGNTGWIAK